jgi:hypothetical protein
MSISKNFGLSGVSSDIQFGKTGPHLKWDDINSQFVITATDNNTLVNLELADPIIPNHAANRHYIDSFFFSANTNNDSVSLTIGTPVAFSSGTFVRADRSALISSRVLGLTFDTTISPSSIGRIQTIGIMNATTVQWDFVTGQSGGLTTGSIYYLAFTPGKLTTIPPPSPSGEYIVEVGMALSSTSLKINITAPILY